MKKCLALGLSVLAIMAMVGCSSNDTYKNNSQDNKTSEVNNLQEANKENEGSE